MTNTYTLIKLMSNDFGNRLAYAVNVSLEGQSSISPPNKSLEGLFETLVKTNLVPGNDDVVTTIPAPMRNLNEKLMRVPVDAQEMAQFCRIYQNYKSSNDNLAKR